MTCRGQPVPVWSLQEIPAGAPPPPLPLGARRAVSHTFPLTAGQRFALSYTGFPHGSAVVAVGLSCALWWVGWSRLEPAVSGSGQPQPLLTEAALQPLLPVPGQLTASTVDEGAHNLRKP